MPIKLPHFLARLQSQKSQQSSPSNNIPGETPDKNLFPEQIFEGNLIYPQEVPPRVINSYYIFTLAVCLVFMLAVFFNTRVDASLKKIKEEQNELVSQLNSSYVDQLLVQKVDNKIKSYKDSLEKRVTLSDKTTLVLDKINPGLALISGKVEAGKFKVTLRGNNIYLFTQAIFAYLKEGYVSEVSIVSANFGTTNEEFTVELSGVLK